MKKIIKFLFSPKCTVCKLGKFDIIVDKISSEKIFRCDNCKEEVKIKK